MLTRPLSSPVRAQSIGWFPRCALGGRLLGGMGLLAEVARSMVLRRGVRRWAKSDSGRSEPALAGVCASHCVCAFVAVLFLHLFSFPTLAKAAVQSVLPATAGWTEWHLAGEPPAAGRSPGSLDVVEVVAVQHEACQLGRVDSVCDATPLELLDEVGSEGAWNEMASRSFFLSGSPDADAGPAEAVPSKPGGSEPRDVEEAVAAPDSEERRAAPMCDPTAASVVAGPFVPDAQSGKVEELPCEQWRLLLQLLGAQVGGSEVGVFVDTNEPPDSAKLSLDEARAVPSPAEELLIRSLRPRVLSPLATERVAAQEFRMAVDRPPAAKSVQLPDVG